MTKLERLQAELEPKIERVSELNGLVEGGSISDTEMVELRTLVADIDNASSDVEVLQRAAEIKKDGIKTRAKAESRTPEQKFYGTLSIGGAAQAIVRNGMKVPTDGIYAELHQEGLREAKERGVDGIVGLAIPSILERTTQTAGVAATAANTISTDMYSFVPAARPMSILDQLGVNVWAGLRGNVEIPAGNGLADSSYNTEMGTAAEQTPTTKLRTMTPKRQASWASYSKQLLEQSSIDIGNWVSYELQSAADRKLCSTVLVGGSTNEPTGLLSLPTSGGDNVLLLALGTNGGNLTRANLLAMETLLDVVNLNEGKVKWLTTPGVKGFLKNLISSSGVGPFVWTDSNDVIGYDAMRTNLLPTNLTKGSASNCHPLILGDWSKIIVGKWGVRDVTVDYLTGSKQAKVEVVINDFNDTVVVHREGFAVCKDVRIDTV